MESFLFIIILIAFIAFLIFRPSLANRKGKRGENAAAWYLHRLPSEYVVYSNIMLPTNYGTTQIDHLVVSPYGAFVIEVKTCKVSSVDMRTRKVGRKTSMATNTK